MFTVVDPVVRSLVRGLTHLFKEDLPVKVSISTRFVSLSFSFDYLEPLILKRVNPFLGRLKVEVPKHRSSTADHTTLISVLNPLFEIGLPKKRVRSVFKMAVTHVGRVSLLVYQVLFEGIPPFRL